ncbi:MAG: RluA family pseudouridine synthase [Chloroflexota bacterium]
MAEEELAEQQEMFEHFRFKADPGQSLLRIDRFLTDRLENTSRTRIQNAANAGCILVNNNPVKPNYKIKPGDVVQIVLPAPPREIELIPENIPLNIVYEDDDLVVVNKEPGMVVHPGYGNYTGTLVNALMWHFKDLPLFSSGESRPGLVHRIDKNTSGILVVAKNEYALYKLSKQFYDRTTDRKYIALVWGVPDPRVGTIVGNVGRSIRDRKVMQVFPEGDEGKPAITHYKVLEEFGYTSLIECKLETGRTHQIRIHLSWMKHPLFNDEEYGGNRIIKGTTFTKYQQFIRNCFNIMPRQALHAKSLAFDHPVTGKRLSFDSELPDDMTQVIEKWRKYVSGREIEE